MSMNTETARPVLRPAKKPPAPELIRLSRILSRGFVYVFPFRFAVLEGDD